MGTNTFTLDLSFDGPRKNPFNFYLVSAFISKVFSSTFELKILITGLYKLCKLLSILSNARESKRRILDNKAISILQKKVTN